MRAFCRAFRFPLKFLCLGCVLFFLAARAQNASNNASNEDPDRSVKPGDDFYRYANGNWLRTATIPAAQSSYDNRAMMAERTSQRVREIVQNAAVSHGAKGSISQKVGDYYASFLDTDKIEAYVKEIDNEKQEEAARRPGRSGGASGTASTLPTRGPEA